MNRSWRSLVVLGVLALALPLVAGADPADTYSADSSPGAVQPSSSKPYTITLANSGGSVDNANQATIAIPAGFTVDSSGLGASTTASGSCTAASWTATVDVGNSRIDVTSPAETASELCPGGVLTVSFDATASASEGSYSWTTELLGASGSFTIEGSQPTVVVDGSPPPQPSIGTHPPAVSSSANASFGFNDSEGAVSFQCKLDDDPFGGCTSPKSYSGLGDGSHTFQVKARDTAGNESAAASFDWTIDTVAPTTTLTGAPPDPSNDPTPSFSFSAGEPSTFECKLDAGAFTACTSPASYGPLPDGDHTFTVRATDAAGNTGPAIAPYGWTIDTLPPSVSLTSTPTNPSTDATPSFSFSANDATSFQCKLDTAAFAACSSPASYGPLDDGSHNFQVKARDTAGNESGPTSFTWTIDTAAPPAPTLTSNPPALSSSASASFGFTDPDAGAGFQCRLDSDVFAACTSPKSYSGLGNGAHTFRVKAVDGAGNESAVSTFDWTIDTVAPPAPTLDSSPPNPSNATSASFAFSDSEPGVTFGCRLDSPGFPTCTSPQSYSGLADGSHTFRLKAFDAAGNESAVVTFTWTVDTAAPPAPTINSGPSDPSNTSSATFTFSDAEGTVGFRCQRDGAGFSACTSPQSYSSLADGAHTFEVKARDAAGNESAVASVGWTVDTVAPPAPTINSRPSNPSNTSSPSFGFSDAEGGVTLRCQRDGGGFAVCTSPQSYSGLADGAHTFQVKARDAAGNESAASTFSWTIDTVAPPAPTINSNPSNPSNAASTSFAFSDSEPGVTFGCRLDSPGFPTCTSPQSYSGLADGSHTFRLKAFDAAGNESAVVTFTWTVDTAAPPAPTINSGPSDPSNTTGASFAFSDSEAGVTFQCRVDAAVFSACTSPKSYSGLANGSHAFRVKAIDAAGNESAVATFAWTVDTAAPPAPSIGSHPLALSSSASASFGFTDPDPAVTFQCRLDADAFASCTSPKSYSGLPDGSHTFQVKARDAAANESGVTSFAWTIDTAAPPAPTTAGPSNPSNTTGPSFTFSDSEPGVTFQCRLDGAAFTACTSPKSYSGLANGSHTFQVKAIDTAGNESAASSFTWTIDTAAPPVPTIGGPPNPSNTSSPNFTFSDSEPGVTFQCRVDAAVFSACTSPKSYPGLADGSHTFQVKARDGAGNESAPASFTWTIDTVPPGTTITSAPPATTNSSSASFGFSASEAATFECRRDGQAFASCTTPKTYSGLAAGFHVFEVRATDTAGNTGPTATYSWTIDTTPPPVPVIDGDIAPPTVTDATTATFVFSDTEPGVTFRCRRDGGAFGSCASPKEYSGLANGSHTFDVTARDAAGNESLAATWAWTVDTLKPVVTIASHPEDPTNKTNATFTFTSNKAGSTFDCKLDGAAFSACTSPKAYSGLADGPHTFQARATDPSGTGTPTAFTWTVDTVPPPAPAIAGGPPAATNATSATFVFSDSEPGLSFECRRDAGVFAGCTSPATYTGFSNGSHAFAVRGIDAAGNTGAAASRGWTVDSLPPDTSVSSGPDAVSGSSSATFGFTSSEGGSSFACSIDGAAFASCVSPQTYGGFGNGPHSFRVRATDAAGNADATPASYSWTVDLLGASRTDRTPPANVANVAKGVGYRRLTLRWTKPTDGDFARVQVLVTNDTRGAPGIVVYNGTGTSYTDAKFRNGVYYRYAIVSFDRAGNASKGVSVVVTANALLGTPRDGARLKTAPLLDWATVRGAAFYNVQLYYRSTKVLSAWPRSSKLKLTKRWSYRGRSYTLKKGRYRWYVWPGFGRLASARYGQLIGQSTFVVG